MAREIREHEGLLVSCAPPLSTAAQDKRRLTRAPGPVLLWTVTRPRPGQSADAARAYHAREAHPGAFEEGRAGYGHDLPAAIANLRQKEGRPRG